MTDPEFMGKPVDFWLELWRRYQTEPDTPEIDRVLEIRSDRMHSAWMDDGRVDATPPWPEDPDATLEPNGIVEEIAS